MGAVEGKSELTLKTKNKLAITISCLQKNVIDRLQSGSLLLAEGQGYLVVTINNFYHFYHSMIHSVPFEKLHDRQAFFATHDASAS